MQDFALSPLPSGSGLNDLASVLIGDLDFDELSLEKRSNQSLKTVDEVERFTLSEDLSETEKAVHLLSPSGIDIQRLSLNLTELCKSSPDDFYNKISPALTELVKLHCSPELHQHLATSFIQLLSSTEPPSQRLVNSRLIPLLQITLSLDTQTAEIWLPVLEFLIPLSKPELVKSELFKEVVTEFSPLSKPVETRKIAALAVGYFIQTNGTCLKAETEILPLVRAFCNDIDARVRCAICQGLQFILKQKSSKNEGLLNSEATKSENKITEFCITSCIELLRDESPEVQTAAINTCITAADKINSKGKLNQVAASFMGISQVSKNQTVLNALSYGVPKLMIQFHAVSGVNSIVEHLFRTNELETVNGVTIAMMDSNKDEEENSENSENSQNFSKMSSPLSIFSEDSRVIIQDSISSIMNTTSCLFSKPTNNTFSPVHLLCIRQLLPALLCNNREKRNYALVSISTRVVKSISAEIEQIPVDFARSVSSSLWRFLVYIFDQDDASVREQIPEYGRTSAKRSSRVTEFEDNSPTISHSSSTLNRSSSVRRASNQSNLLDSRVDYLVNRFLELIACLQYNESSWNYLETLIDTIPYFGVSMVSNFDHNSTFKSFREVLEKAPDSNSMVDPTRNTIVKLLTPQLFKLVIDGKHLPVRKSAARNLVFLLKICHLQTDRQTVIVKILDLAKSDSFRCRMLFLYLTKSLIEEFSRDFVKNYRVFDECLNLSTDRVPNVRLALCRLLPNLKALLRLPKDRLKLQQLESIARLFYSHDADQDVTKEAEQVIRLLDQTNIAVESLRAVPEDEAKDALDAAKLAHEETINNLESQTGQHLAVFPESENSRNLQPKSSSLSALDDRNSRPNTSPGNRRTITSHNSELKASSNESYRSDSTTSSTSSRWKSVRMAQRPAGSLTKKSGQKPKTNSIIKPGSAVKPVASTNKPNTSNKTTASNNNPKPEKIHKPEKIPKTPASPNSTSTQSTSKTTNLSKTSNSAYNTNNNSHSANSSFNSSNNEPWSAQKAAVKIKKKVAISNKTSNQPAFDPFGHWSSSSDEDDNPRKKGQKKKSPSKRK